MSDKSLVVFGHLHVFEAYSRAIRRFFTTCRLLLDVFFQE